MSEINNRITFFFFSLPLCLTRNAIHRISTGMAWCSLISLLTYHVSAHQSISCIGNFKSRKRIFRSLSLSGSWRRAMRPSFFFFFFFNKPSFLILDDFVFLWTDGFNKSYFLLIRSTRWDIYNRLPRPVLLPPSWDRENRLIISQHRCREDECRRRASKVRSLAIRRPFANRSRWRRSRMRRGSHLPFKSSSGGRASKCWLFEQIIQIESNSSPFIKQKFGNLTDASAIVNWILLLPSTKEFLAVGLRSGARAECSTRSIAQLNRRDLQYSTMVVNQSSSFSCDWEKRSLFFCSSGISTCNARLLNNDGT